MLFCKLPELLVPEELLNALEALEDAARGMAAWTQFTVLPSLDDFTGLPGRGVGKKASKSNTKAVHSQGLWLLKPEDQFMAEKIYKLLMKALTADDIWEAMEYLMAARGLLKTTVAHVSKR